MRKSLLLLALFCAACSNYSANLPSIKPYRMDINQGNVVTPKMMMQLRPGMSKAQVKFIMGTPLIVDAFHPNRWDYFYQMRKDGKIIEQRRVIMEFENEKLARIRGDVIPAGSDSAGVAGDKPANKAPVTLKSVGDPKPKEKGLLDSLKFWGDDEPAAAPAAKPEAAPVAEPVKPAAAPEPVKSIAPAEAPAPAATPVEPVAAEVVAPAVAPSVAAPEVEPAPEPKAEPAPVVKPEAIVPPPRTESSGAGIKLQPKSQPAPLPRVEPKSAPVAEPEPVVEPIEPVVAQPVEKAAEAPKPRVRSNEPKPVPKPGDELPAEDAPDYFERMLEKIGF